MQRPTSQTTERMCRSVISQMRAAFSDSDIVWSDANRTVTLTGENTVVKLTVGSNIIQTSTGTVTADVPGVIEDNRTYLSCKIRR